MNTTIQHSIDYSRFLESKSQRDSYAGFEPLWMPDCMFGFQKSLTDWNIRKGKSLTAADCGLGKTLMELVWAQNIVMKTNRPVLVAAPLAVSAQTVREANRFGIEVNRSMDGTVKPGINITNYERLHYFNPDDFAGMAGDESACIKNFQGVRRGQITEFMRRMDYRLLATATAAPNDYVELGTSSEALGELGYIDMLNRYFKNQNNNVGLGRHYGEAVQWEFRGHAQDEFWRWVASWARAVRKPSDLGFDDGDFILPELRTIEHLIECDTPPEGALFTVPATTMREQRAETKRALEQRCERAAALAAANNGPTLIWCHLNDEGDLLEKLIPGAVQVSGRDKDEAKEEAFMAFADGKIPNLITKPKIGAWGLNFQVCSHVVTFPTHSYEQYYQGVRRCWRFGQRNPVTVDIVLTEGERLVIENLQRKAAAADVMFERLVYFMRNAMSVARPKYSAAQISLPSWLN